MTQAQNQLLNNWREELRDQLEDGTTLRKSLHEGHLVTAQIVGNLDVIKKLMGIDYQGLVSGVEK